jgi:glucosylglycerate phosphorylase
MLREERKPPLRSLREFCQEHLEGVVSCIHLLPFFPSSSDEGFSVMDYRSVDPALGTWEDIGMFRPRFRLMVDAVFNHVSSRGAWFQGFLADEKDARRMFIVVDEGTDLSMVVRPRSQDLLTPFRTPSGRKLVWTTFSADQVDLDYSNPEVLLRMTEILLLYVGHGAELIRMDAIGYIWKKRGTPCINLPEAHLVVQVFRSVLDAVSPRVALVTETNVPHQENISWFGDGANEAQLVYNFSLPPLVLHAFCAGDAGVLAHWAGTLCTPSSDTTFLNFLASHDGIGVVPARGILSDSEIQVLVERTLSAGGLVSYKTGPGGTLVPYELNINYWDALSNPGGTEDLDTGVRRFLAAHAIMLCLAGVPAIYFHSLFGSTGWAEGPTLTGSTRAINRQRLERRQLEAELQADSRRRKVLSGLKRLLTARSASPCFHPKGAQRVLRAEGAVFAVA